HCRVLVELDVGTVGTTAFLLGANDDRLDDVTLLHVSTGDGVLDRGHDGVAHSRVTAAGTTEHADAEDLLRTGVVRDTQSRLLLGHCQTPVVEPVLSRGLRLSLAGRCGCLVLTRPSRGSPPRATARLRTAGGSP